MNLPSPGQPPTRNLWPLAIVTAFTVFIAATATLIVVSVSQTDDLVTADYYDQELRYQEQLDRTDRTRPIRDLVTVRYEPEHQQIALSLPLHHAALHPTGRVSLYRPASADQDREVTLEVDPAGHQRVDARLLNAGLWRVRIRWTAGGEDFSIEERLVIPAKPT